MYIITDDEAKKKELLIAPFSITFYSIQIINDLPWV